MQDELNRIIPVPGSDSSQALDQARDFDNGAYETLFEVSPHGQFVPRAIFVDSETSVIDEVRNGMYRCLFHPNDMITHHEDCSNNFARGNITIGKKMIDKVMERIRKAVEHTDLLQGFIATHSCSGGTGGGLTAYIFQCLLADYDKYSVIQLPIYPSPQHANTIVEPYNTVLHLDQAVDAVKLSTMMDNEAIGEVCHRNLMHRQPTFHTMNQVIALLTSSLLSPVRYPGCLTAGLPELETNLVPFPRIHFPVLRHAPFLHFSRSTHQTSSIDQLVQNVFSAAGQTVKCDLNRGKFMACVLSFRGLVGPRLVNSALSRIKATPHLEFVDWCPTGVKVNLVAQPPIFMAHDSHLAPTDCSVTMLANSTAIRSVWATVGAKFDMMFSRRCFLHWFLNEGLEESEMKEARETLASIEQDYREIGTSGERNLNFFTSTMRTPQLKRRQWRKYNPTTQIPLSHFSDESSDELSSTLTNSLSPLMKLPTAQEENTLPSKQIKNRFLTSTRMTIKRLAVVK
ncbi:Tubulin alpha chain [Paragonimus heterotremus]|uniref:Tubulin alpha chain n=1 Tax=Paragonimus heterotremus TaxID=100268 RepID=A0A8J4TBW2_9TREM|nr:Tubulin alpha chain [Paragonimus heterotremus]